MAGKKKPRRGGKPRGGANAGGGKLSSGPPQGTQSFSPVRSLREFDGLPEGIVQGEDAPVLSSSAWGQSKGVKQQLGLKKWDALPAVSAADPFVIASPLVPSEIRLRLFGPTGAARTPSEAEPILLAEAGVATGGAEVRRTLLGTLVHPPADLVSSDPEAGQAEAQGVRATIEAAWITDTGEETITWALRLQSGIAQGEAEHTGTEPPAES